MNTKKLKIMDLQKKIHELTDNVTGQDGATYHFVSVDDCKQIAEQYATEKVKEEQNKGFTLKQLWLMAQSLHQEDFIQAVTEMRELNNSK